MILYIRRPEIEKDGHDGFYMDDMLIRGTKTDPNSHATNTFFFFFSHKKYRTVEKHDSCYLKPEKKNVCIRPTRPPFDFLGVCLRERKHNPKWTNKSKA